MSHPPPRIHRFDQQHAVYMHAVAEEFRKYLALLGISGKEMTPAQAQDFAEYVTVHTDPRISLVMVRSYGIEDHAPFRTFERLSQRIEDFLSRFGRADAFRGDFWLLDDHWGCAQVLVHIINLDLLRSEVIDGLRALLRRFPDWEIVVAVAPNDHLYDWPAMGLYIRNDGIIDGLLREYLPPELRDVSYEAARAGGIDD